MRPPYVVEKRNPRPFFHDDAEAVFFEKTSKRRMFEMLRETSELLVSMQIDGYTAGDDPLLWMWQANNVGQSVPEKGANNE